MTAQELINKLKEFPPDAEVLVPTSNFEKGNSSVSAQYVTKQKMRKESKRFRDAFDGESYDSFVWVYDDKNGEECISMT